MIREVQMLQLSFSVELMEECKTSLLAFECLRGLQHAYLSPAAVLCSHEVFKDAVF